MIAHSVIVEKKPFYLLVGLHLFSILLILYQNVEYLYYLSFALYGKIISEFNEKSVISNKQMKSCQQMCT